MARRPSIQSQFREKIGEVAYSPNQVAEMLNYVVGDFRYTSGEIREYAKCHGLAVELGSLGITPAMNSDIKWWIPKSNLEIILNGMGISVRVADIGVRADDVGAAFDAAAHALGYQL